MTYIDASGLDHNTLNDRIAAQTGNITISNCLGQRFIAAGMSGQHIRITGVPGNAMGAYLNGATIETEGNAQDAVGDTMNDGLIAVHGSIGDTAGYAMRGGRIYVKGNAGYRAGVHMKEYHDRLPVMIIGGRAGSFLGEYQAGGLIAVLGLHADDKPIVSNFPCTGMHGGKLFLRSDCKNILFPQQVTTHLATEEELVLIKPFLREFCNLFAYDYETVMDAAFTVVSPDSRNPYKQLYVAN